MDLQKFVADGVAEFGDAALGLEFHLLEENLAGERIAVGVQAAGGEADDGVAGADGFAVEHFGFFDDADDGAADVVLPRFIKAGHLGGFAADEGAIIFGATAREAGDEFGEDVGLQFAGADVIEEEKRFRAEDGDVVHAMVDEVLADGVVAVHGEGELELGADAVGAGDEDGLAVFFDVEGEEAAEAADLAEDFRAVRGREELRQRGFDAIAEVNVHTRAGVSFLFHESQKRATKREHETAAERNHR